MKLLYGYNDRENAIHCTLSEIELTEQGAIYTAKTGKGDKIIAPCGMFQTLYRVNIDTPEGAREVRIYARTPEEAQRNIKLKRGEHLRGVMFA